MKYVITFHNKLKDGIPRDQTLIFGEYDIKGVAKKCFELGTTGNFDSISFKRVNNTTCGCHLKTESEVQE